MGLAFHKSPAHVGLSYLSFLDHLYSHHPKGLVMGLGQAPEALHAHGYTLPATKSLPLPAYTPHHIVESFRAHTLSVSLKQLVCPIPVSRSSQGWLKQPPFLSHGLPS